MSATFVKIIHELANGVDKSVRDKALQKTQKYLLEHGHELSETDFARLWQGLYFCFWLTDKDYVQHQVGRFIARLIHAISPNEAEQGHHKRFAARFAFFKTFFSTMEEQWKTIDQHRSAKFMSLMRYVIHETFVFLRDDCAYSHQSIVAFTQVLRQGPLAMKQYSTIPILTHIIDIFVEEAEKVFARNESSKIYDVDEDIEYDALDFIKGQQVKTQKKPEEVLEIKFEDLMKLLDPFFTLYSQTPTDSIAIAFEKGMFKELEDYKAKDATIVEQVLQEPYLNKRGIYVAASLRRVEEYARPAKGSLQIDLNAIAAKFKELSQRTKTRNKQRCIEQHNRFVTATAQKKIRDKEDPLAVFEQELTEVKSQKSSSSTTQKKSKAAEMLDESYHSDEDGDFEQQEDSDEEMEDLDDIEDGDEDNEDAMDEEDLEDALEDLDEDLPIEVIRAFKQGKISVEELAEMLDAMEEQRSSAKGKAAAKAAQSAPASSSAQKKQKQQQQATETAAAATIKKRKFGKGSEAAPAPAQDTIVEDQDEEVATPLKASKASKKVAAPVAEVETSRQAEKATLSKISKSFQEKKKEQQASSKITSSVAKAVAKQLKQQSEQSKAAEEESTSAVEDGDEDRDKPKKRVSFGFQNNQTKVFAINTSPISLSHGVAAKNPPLVPLAAKKAKKRLSA